MFNTKTEIKSLIVLLSYAESHNIMGKASKAWSCLGLLVFVSDKKGFFTMNMMYLKRWSGLFDSNKG